jgi:hypothetical protein
MPVEAQHIQRSCQTVSDRRPTTLETSGQHAGEPTSTISAANIRGRLGYLESIGILDGFEWLMHGDVEHVTPLTINAVNRIHCSGDSLIWISRANPTLKHGHLQNTIISLLHLGVT